jgi:hypothetical protein
MHQVCAATNAFYRQSSVRPTARVQLFNILPRITRNDRLAIDTITALFRVHQLDD